ncbi:MAG: hypothetical protein WD830_03485 [Chloroflexota bacterium]
MEAIEGRSVIGLLRRTDGDNRDLAATRRDPAELVLGVLMSSTHRKGSLERADLDR